MARNIDLTSYEATIIYKHPLLSNPIVLTGNSTQGRISFDDVEGTIVGKGSDGSLYTARKPVIYNGSLMLLANTPTYISMRSWLQSCYDGGITQIGAKILMISAKGLWAESLEDVVFKTNPTPRGLGSETIDDVRYNFSFNRLENILGELENVANIAIDINNILAR